VRGVSLTGSERAGAAVAELAGRHLKKVVLELGGSDPFILLSTDDLDAAVKTAVSARLGNTGQACNAGKRFIVVDELYEPFLEKVTAAITAVKPADPMSDTTRIGTLVAGGERDGNFFSTTVLTDITSDNDAYREEFFGPVASVYRVASEDEAVALANDTPFGLGSYVMTVDPEQALRVADQMDAGMVFINGVGLATAELPFGGVKRSGFGRELGRFGLEEFVNKKLIRVAG
jgi:succinate-semialdehyde dehydrogenase/glutarate-semialdehyde dehydrogenase